jgi:hypothetical protein
VALKITVDEAEVARATTAAVKKAAQSELYARKIAAIADAAAKEFLNSKRFKAQVREQMKRQILDQIKDDIFDEIPARFWSNLAKWMEKRIMAGLNRRGR